MPHEDRHIYFDFAETYKAIYALSVQKELKKPPPGAIVAIKVDPANDKNILVNIGNSLDSTAVSEHGYTRDFLAAALMLYCRTLHIPLPKGARKSVDVGPDKVILHISI